MFYPNLGLFFLLLLGIISISLTVHAVGTVGGATQQYTHNTTGLSQGSTKCLNKEGNFSIIPYPTWKQAGGCTIFSPHPKSLYQNVTEPYIHISVYSIPANSTGSQIPANKSLQVFSLLNLYNDVRYFTWSSNPFRLVHGPDQYDLNGTDAFIMRYETNGTSIEGLPYANHSITSSQFPKVSSSGPNSLSQPLSVSHSLSQAPNNTKPKSANDSDTNSGNTNNSNTDKSKKPEVNVAPFFQTKVLVIYSIKNSKIYLIEYNGPSSTFDQNFQAAQATIQSFSFINDNQ